MSTSSDNEDLELNEEQSSDDEEVASDEASGGNVAEESDEDDGVQKEDEESDAGEPDINASATESDEDDDEVDDDKDIPQPTKKIAATSPKIIEKITNEIKERHEKRKGKQLYIRFPEKLPDTTEEFQKKIKALSDLIVEGHKPRQKHARFCLVDFASTENRDKALKELKKKDSKLVVSIPKTDSDEFVQTLVEKRIKQKERKRAKNLLRQQSKKSVIEKEYTSILLVLNLPSSASNAQIKELFPNAVDIQTKGAGGKYKGKMIATVTMPSTEDAKVNAKRKLTLGGNSLIVRFNTDKKNKKKKAKKGPVAPANPEAKKSPKKRSISENGSSDVAEKKAKVEVSAKANVKGAKKAKPDAGAKGKKPMPPNKKNNPEANGKADGKPNKKNKKKNQPPKKGKAAVAAAE